MPDQFISLHRLQRIASKRGARFFEIAPELCKQCRKIRLRLDENLPANDTVVVLGPLKRIKQRGHCALCNLSFGLCRPLAGVRTATIPNTL
jgi:hypothetical protein